MGGGSKVGRDKVTNKESPMISQQKWFERKFDFSYPVSRFPGIFQRILGAPARLEELVHSLPQNILTVKPGGAWSIKEHVGHLYDLDALHDARIDDYLSGATTLRAADLNNRRTDDANHNAKPIEEILKQFREARMHFVKRLEPMNEEQLARTAVHPRLNQQMRLVDMATFVAEHDDHHMAAISDLAGRAH
jgi:uncharacterized damage-inducible protein DinB